MKYKCPCCGYYTLDEFPDGNYEICEICYWEDDPMAYDDPGEACCCNGVSLLQARENFRRFGACNEAMKANVRIPQAEDKICADISELLLNGKRIAYPGLSVEAYLEAIIGKYYLLGNPDGFEYVYYPVDENNFTNIFLNKENLVAIISERIGIAVVLREAYDKFYNDTKQYQFKYVVIDDWQEENMECRDPRMLPEEYRSIEWIEDDFLSNEEIEFDYDAFARIDEGVEYLNPLHFSFYDFAGKVSPML